MHVSLHQRFYSHHFHILISKSWSEVKCSYHVWLQQGCQGNRVESEGFSSNIYAISYRAKQLLSQTTTRAKQLLGLNNDS